MIKTRQQRARFVMTSPQFRGRTRTVFPADRRVDRTEPGIEGAWHV